MRSIAFGCEAGLVAQTSVCALLVWVFPEGRTQIKPTQAVLLDRAGLMLNLHAMERADGHS
jgi:hypothetical protein